MCDKFHQHLNDLLFDERLTKNSGKKIKLEDLKKAGDFFSIAGGLEIGAKCWSLQQETGYLTALDCMNSS